MNIKQLREVTGLTQKKFSERFKIPLRTVQNWESGTNAPADYIPRLIEMVMILENEIEQLRGGQLSFGAKEDPQQKQPQEKEKSTDTVQEPKNDKELLRKIKHSLEEIEIDDLYCENCVYGRECNYNYIKCEKYKDNYKACDCIDNWIYWENLERMIENV